MIPRPIPHGQAPQTPPTIYLIRHGEKNTNPQEGSLTGLNAAGETRAHALPQIFNAGNTNPYDIRFISAMQPQPDGDQERPWQTIWPLALSLQQTLNNYCLIDNTVLRDNTVEEAQRIKDFIASGSSGNMLVCWEHHNLHKILGALGFANAPKYPAMFDVVWELEPTPVLHPKSGKPEIDPTSGLPQWSYNTIRWSTEGTAADIALASDDALWKQTANAPDDLVLSPSGTVPVFGWKALVTNGSDPTDN